MDAVKAHYERPDLVKQIERALVARGLGERPLTLEDLQSLDHFHSRGVAATADIAACLEITSGSRVLDIGSGLGGPARFIAEKYGASVTGIDLTQSYVDAANYLTERTGLSELVHFDCGDALSLPYPDGAFDFAVMQHVGMNIKDRDKLYSEAHRVLKKGGLLSVYDVVANGDSDVFFPMPWADGPETSFLLTALDMLHVLKCQNFLLDTWIDRTAVAIEWFEKFAQQQAQATTPPLGMGIVFGPDFKMRVANLEKSLKEGRASVIEVVMAARA